MSAAVAAISTSTQSIHHPPIERLYKPDYHEFIQRFLRPRQPVLIEGGIDHWPATRKWTPEFWSQQYGQRQVTIEGKKYSIQELIQKALEPKSDPPPPYYRNIRIGEDYPELEADISPAPKYATPNWFVNPAFRRIKNTRTFGYGQYELFIGGAGRKFPYLHYDVPGAHTFIYHLAGRKDFILFPPSDRPFLYPKGGSEFNVSAIPDVDNVSLDQFPLYAKATRIDISIGPGDTLFMPSGWWHTAKMLSFSISLGIDVANETNWEDIRGFLAQKARVKLGRIGGALFMVYINWIGNTLGRTERIPTTGS